MQIVIDIPESIYDTISDDQTLSREQVAVLEKHIYYGTPLPKGHGRLIDADKISDRLKKLRDGWNYYGNEYESGRYQSYDYALDEVMDTPTILEADEAESEE